MAYTIGKQKTGVFLGYNRARIGGWNQVEQHLFILGTFAERYEHGMSILEHNGFERIPRPSGTAVWWRLPVSRFSFFWRAISEITGEAVDPDIKDEFT